MDPREMASGRGRGTRGEGPDPLSGYIGERVEDPEASASFTVLTEAVRELEKEYWHLWIRLEPLYFRIDNNPSFYDTWVTEAASGSLGDRLALQDHRAAVDFIASYAERELKRRYGYDRLKLYLPMRVKNERDRKAQVRRRRAVDVLCRYWEMARIEGLPAKEARAQAVREAARECGYSLKEMRSFARDVEGDVKKEERGA